MAIRERDGAATRERILDVALELFTEQGYEKTSLREIAERLGITKAALYYYFERKDDILLELHLRLHALGRDVLDQLDEVPEQEILAVWPVLLDRFVDEVLANRALFQLHHRNQNAFQRLAEDPRHAAENDDMEERFRRIMANEQLPLADRVRMLCSVGAVFMALMGANANGMFGDVPLDEVAQLVRESVRDLMRPA